MKTIFASLFGLIIISSVSAQSLSLNNRVGDIYGTLCGIAGDMPILRKQLERAIEERDIDLLSSWVSGRNAVLSAYAAEGFIRLYNEGMEIDDDLKTRVEEIKLSDETINTCHGCIYSSLSLKEALKDFEFKP